MAFECPNRIPGTSGVPAGVVTGNPGTPFAFSAGNHVVVDPDYGGLSATRTLVLKIEAVGGVDPTHDNYILGRTVTGGLDLYMTSAGTLALRGYDSGGTLRQSKNAGGWTAGTIWWVFVEITNGGSPAGKITGWADGNATSTPDKSSSAFGGTGTGTDFGESLYLGNGSEVCDEVIVHDARLYDGALTSAQSGDIVGGSNNHF